MTEEERKAVEALHEDLKCAKEDDSIDIDVFTFYLEVALNLIQKLEEENKKKDKMIKEMAPRVYLTQEEQEEMRRHIYLNTTNYKGFADYVINHFKRKAEEE